MSLADPFELLPKCYWFPPHSWPRMPRNTFLLLTWKMTTLGHQTFVIPDVPYSDFPPPPLLDPDYQSIDFWA